MCDYVPEPHTPYFEQRIEELKKSARIDARIIAGYYSQIEGLVSRVEELKELVKFRELEIDSYESGEQLKLRTERRDAALKCVEELEAGLRDRDSRIDKNCRDIETKLRRIEDLEERENERCAQLDADKETRRKLTRDGLVWLCNDQAERIAELEAVLRCSVEWWHFHIECCNFEYAEDELDDFDHISEMVPPETGEKVE